MIAPLANMTLRGFLWYQGESDLTSHADPAQYYECMFPKLVDDWRRTFDQPDLAFFFVQLAAYTELGPYGMKLGVFRMAQESALARPLTCMATAVDLGDFTSPLGNIHPRDKQTVAARLGACAQRLLYGQNVPIWGPVAHNVTHVSSKVAVVAFMEVQSVELRAQPACPAAASECAGWMVMSGKGVWSPAVKVWQLDALHIAVQSATSDIAGVGYLLADWPLCSLYGDNGLPATPFALLIKS
jgi:sialate O-acetylesterase